MTTGFIGISRCCHVEFAAIDKLQISSNTSMARQPRHYRAAECPKQTPLSPLTKLTLAGSDRRRARPVGPAGRITGALKRQKTT